MVALGYQPWVRCCIVSVWEDGDDVAIMHCTRDGYKAIYIKYGLKCQAALEFETKRITNEEFFVMDKTMLPADRLERDNWTANFRRKIVEIKND